MPRIRSIKPEFFFDEELCELDHTTRLTLIGLWCQADREGRLPDTPKKLKAQIFPYESVEMEQVLISLTKKPFIHRYESDGKRYIQIISFLKHQRPHHTEQSSTIPPNNGCSTVPKPFRHPQAPSPSPSPSNNFKYNVFFDNLWNSYPKRDGKKEALRHFNASVKTEQDFIDIKKALANYLMTENVIKGNVQYIKNGSTWFNNWRDWVNYEEPKKKQEFLEGF